MCRGDFAIIFERLRGFVRSACFLPGGFLLCCGLHSYLGDMVIKPLRAQFAVNIVKIAIIISSHVFKYAKHSPSINEGEKRSDKAFMNQIR